MNERKEGKERKEGRKHGRRKGGREGGRESHGKTTLWESGLFWLLNDE